MATLPQRLSRFAPRQFFFRVLRLTIERAMPFVNLMLGFVFCYSISFLDSSYQLIALAGNHIQIVIRQLAPTGFRGAFDLLPLSCHLVPVHKSLLIFHCLNGRVAAGPERGNTAKTPLTKRNSGIAPEFYSVRCRAILMRNPNRNAVSEARPADVPAKAKQNPFSML